MSTDDAFLRLCAALGIRASENAHQEVPAILAGVRRHALEDAAQVVYRAGRDEVRYNTSVGVFAMRMGNTIRSLG